MGNFLLPIMIGTKDLAFPRINLISWYIYVIGAIVTLAAVFSGGLDTGWTFYTPYSSVASQSAVSTAALGVFITGFSSILTGLNFIVTVHRMRAPGMTWFRLPLFVWAQYATSLVMILGTPVIAITVLLVFAERTLHLGFFDPTRGGDPVLFQHLFWFYSHPAVYIMILPGMGVMSELVSAVSRKQVFGYSFVAFSSLAIAILGFLVWGHHLFVSSQSIYAGLVFSIITMLVAVPVGREDVQLGRDDVQGLGDVGVADLLGARLHGPVHDRRADGAVPRDDGPRHPPDGHLLRRRALPLHHGRRRDHGLHGRPALLVAEDDGPACTTRPAARRRAILVFVGFNLTFFPQFVLGYMGMPRRYHAYPEEWQVLNVLSSAGASILALGYALPAFYLTYSLIKGAKAPANPWGAKGLEWTVPSPPPTFNFDEDPVVDEPAYNYKPGREVHVG